MTALIYGPPNRGLARYLLVFVTKPLMGIIDALPYCDDDYAFAGCRHPAFSEHYVNVMLMLTFLQEHGSQL